MPLHPLPAAEDILKGIVEGVPHMESAGNVRRRDDDTVRFFLRDGCSAEVTFIFPFGVPSLLDFVGLIPLGKLSFRHDSLLQLFRLSYKKNMGTHHPHIHTR
jgi:hypothetical protein